MEEGWPRDIRPDDFYRFKPNLIHLLCEIGGDELDSLTAVAYHGPFRIEFHGEVWYEIFFVGDNEYDHIATEELVYRTRNWSKGLYFLLCNREVETVTDIIVFELPPELANPTGEAPDMFPESVPALCDSPDDEFLLQHNYGGKKRKPNLQL